VSDPIRIVVADDHALLRTGLAGILGSQDDLEVVGEAVDGKEAVRVVRELEPDVVLMDVRMPELDGIEATRQLVDSSSRILMLTTFDLDKYVYAAMKAGAAGFLLKDAAPEVLIEAVRAVARGEALLAPQITRRLIEEFVRRPEPGAAADTVLAVPVRGDREDPPRPADGQAAPARPGPGRRARLRVWPGAAGRALRRRASTITA
jgi:DNA-binding NarL/FixJ family response regulator